MSVDDHGGGTIRLESLRALWTAPLATYIRMPLRLSHFERL